MFIKFRSIGSLSGVVLIILVAVSFATNSTLAKISFDHGATPLSVITWRTALAAFSVFVNPQVLGGADSLALESKVDSN